MQDVGTNDATGARVSLEPCASGGDVPPPIAPDPLPSAQSFSTWKQCWDSLGGHHADRVIPSLQVPLVLLDLCRTLPHVFAGYCAQLAGVAFLDVQSHPGGLTAESGRRRRQRDVLPLPQARFSAEELPRQNTLSEGHPGRLAARSALLTLMIVAINFHYCDLVNDPAIRVHDTRV